MKTILAAFLALFAIQADAGTITCSNFSLSSTSTEREVIVEYAGRTYQTWAFGLTDHASEVKFKHKGKQVKIRYANLALNGGSGETVVRIKIGNKREKAPSCRASVKPDLTLSDEADYRRFQSAQVQILPRPNPPSSVPHGITPRSPRGSITGERLPPVQPGGVSIPVER